MIKFNHVSSKLQDPKKVVFTAQSCKNFHQRMLICKHAFQKGVIPINPFNTFGYFLYELVERDLVRNANNNLLKRCDELWVYGDISDGVLVEIKIFKDMGKPIRFFDISNLPKQVKELSKNELNFEDGLDKYSHLI